MNSYNKPKDRYFAALIVLVGFILIPLSILKAAVLDIGSWFKDLIHEFRREFKGGVRVTATYAYKEVMDSLAGRRARRERRRNVVNAPL